jgi:hypothetical protein
MASAATRKKMLPVVKRAAADQAEVRLVDQGGGLQGLPGCLGRHPGGREPTELVIDQRQQVGGGSTVPSRGGVVQLCYVGHADSIYGRAARTQTNFRRPTITPDTGHLLLRTRLGTGALTHKRPVVRNSVGQVPNWLPRAGAPEAQLSFHVDIFSGTL